MSVWSMTPRSRSLGYEPFRLRLISRRRSLISMSFSVMAGLVLAIYVVRPAGGPNAQAATRNRCFTGASGLIYALFPAPVQEAELIPCSRELIPCCSS